LDLEFIKMKKLVPITLFLLISLNVQAGDLPDNRLTPGAIDTSITQQNIYTTVCVKGYTKTVRPPVYFTNKLKKEQILQYDYTDTNPTHYEEDHLIPLSIGGNPDSPLNLWPQPRISEWNAEKKDVLELKLQKMVCSGQVGLDEARNAIATDWIATYKKYVSNSPN
jgi:hypothetical protein